MNQLTEMNQTMTILEIAKLTGSPHNDVLNKARKLLEDLGIDGVKFDAICLGVQNKEKPMLSCELELEVLRRSGARFMALLLSIS